MGVADGADSEAGGGAGGGEGGAGPDPYITTGYQVAKENIIIVLRLISVLLRFFIPIFILPKGWCQCYPNGWCQCYPMVGVSVTQWLVSVLTNWLVIVCCCLVCSDRA